MIPDVYVDGDDIVMVFLLDNGFFLVVKMNDVAALEFGKRIKISLSELL
jgi:hypothetical protein